MHLFLTAYRLALLPMMNPPTTAVLMLGLAMGRADDWFEVEARRVAVFLLATLLVAYFAGKLTLEVLGLSMPSLQLAVGLIVAFIGFCMLSPAPAAAGATAASEGVPRLRAAHHAQPVWPRHLGARRLAGAGPRRPDAAALGASRIDALTRIMSFLLVCIGMQFLISVVFALADELAAVGSPT